MNHLRSVKSQDQCLLAWLFRDPPTSPRSSPAVKDVIDRMISGFRGHENSRDLCDINFPGWEWRNSRMLKDLFAQHRLYLTCPVIRKLGNNGLGKAIVR